MTPVRSQHPELLVPSSLKAICATSGPFITVYLPACHPGASDLPAAPRLRTMVRAAAAELNRRRYLEPSANLLAPIEELAGSPATVAGGDASAIFSAPGLFRHLRLPAPVSERLVVATYAHITPLLPDMIMEPELYILAISTKHLRLGRWCGGECKEVPLPASIPKTLAAAGDFDVPDHNLEGRSTAGGSAGQMGRIRFGTSSDRDGAYLHNYFCLVDRELSHVLRGAPLVEIGVRSSLTAYRRAAKYPRMLEARHTGAEQLSWAEMGQLGEQAALAAARHEAESVLAEAGEATLRDHVISGVRPVLESAREGRIHKLLLAQGTEYEGLPGPHFSMADARIEGPQDLLNAAAVEVIRAGGEVHVLDPRQLGSLGPIAAILRYSPC